MRARMHAYASADSPSPMHPLAGGEEVVQVSNALPGFDALYLPLTVTVAKKEEDGRTRMRVLDAFVAKLDRLLTVGVGPEQVQTRIHQ